jgi:hypothetical protein
MITCRISIYLAYAMLIYCISSAYYLIRTRQIGTPFNDSLTTEQRKIKAKSSSARGNIFVQGLLIGFGIIIIFRPFRKC